jgi:hypothetical protein
MLEETGLHAGRNWFACWKKLVCMLEETGRKSSWQPGMLVALAELAHVHLCGGASVTLCGTLCSICSVEAVVSYHRLPSAFM